MMLCVSGGEQSITEALEGYAAAWTAFIAEHSLQNIDEAAHEATISWKVADRAALFENVMNLASLAEQIHIATVNDRFIATVVLAEPYQGIYLIKILERRKESEDPLGLDSIDYLVDKPAWVYDSLSRVPEVFVEKQHNEMHEWVSLRFGAGHAYEAKFTDHLVLHVARKELALSEHTILARLGVV